MNLEDIRIWDGSKNRAFEELITQIAMNECPKDSEFFATHGKGGDGGVECYSVLKNGNEWGWQSKFVKRLNETTIRQIEQSIFSAIRNHPKLKKYYICVPFNRTSKTNEGRRRSEIDKWNKKVKEWEGKAKKKSINIKFEFWGESEIIKFLQKPENSGLLYFWFSQIEFSEDWFEKHIRVIKSIAGPRYTPELNIELDISKIFEGLGRTKEFLYDLKLKSKKLSDTFNSFKYSIFRFVLNRKLRKSILSLETKSKTIAKVLYNITSDVTQKIDFGLTSNLSNTCLNELFEIQNSITKETKVKIKLQHTNEYDDFTYRCTQLREQYLILKNYSNSSVAKSSNTQCVFLKGEWGTGKTHLFCDLLENLIKRGNYSFLVFGQNLTGTSILLADYLKGALDINGNTLEEIFSVFNSLGRTFGGRVILFIDALNEGMGKDYWIHHLQYIRSKLSDYPYVALALSCRTTYINSVKPEEFDCLEINHYGFGDSTFDAMKSYFNYYNLQLPSFPILVPEFSRPMFLKIFCEGLSKAGYNSLPQGITGINSIFNLYINAVEVQISQKLHLLPARKYVMKSIKALINDMILSGKDYVLFDRAHEIIESIKPSSNDRDSLFFSLISEGVLIQNKLTEDEIISFGYERLSDFFKTNHMLESIDGKEISKQFKPKGIFYFLVEKSKMYYHQGLIEALSVILPEKYNIELFEVLKFDERDEVFHLFDPFLLSLIWREKGKTTSKTEDFFVKIINYSDAWKGKCFETLLSLSTIPNHRFDIFWLHRRLIKFNMPERDILWSLEIHKLYDVGGPIDKIIKWGIKTKNFDVYDKEVIFNSSITLSWFLTNSNRDIRDKSTRALVNLLKTDLNLVIKLLEEFKDINDLYVLERLYCVAYGCCVLSSDKPIIFKVADYVFDKVFKNGKPIPHVLIRDYSRQILEYSITIGYKLSKKDIKLIRPPYKSSKPIIPSEGIWKKYDYKNGYASLTSSIGSMGDFYRYTLGGNSNKYFLHKNFKIKDVAKWILKKVLRIGWKPKLFQEIERIYFNDWSRTNHRVERIGKKYQWIAYYEICAMVLDNYEDIQEYHWEKPNYEGPWQYYMRNIDPTNIFYCEKSDNKELHQWEPKYSFPLKIDIKWMKSRKDIPNPSDLILIYDNFYKKHFYNLEFHFSRKNDEEYELKEKYINLWYMIRALFVKKNKIKDVIKSLEPRRMGKEFEPISNTCAFLGEHFWSRSIEFKSNWESVEYDDNSSKNVIRTTSSYSWDDSFDYSENFIHHVYLPSSWIIENSDIRWSKKDFSFVNSENEVICYDPGTLIGNNDKSFEKSNGLLIEKSFFEKFLKRNNISVVWLISGEKIYMEYRPQDRNPYGRLIIKGAYYFEKNKVKGNYNINLVDW